MKTAVRIIVAALLVGLGLGVWLFVSWNREEPAGGPALESVLDSLNSRLAEVRVEAETELRRRGTNALPQLLAMLRGGAGGQTSSGDSADKRSQLGDAMERGRARRLAAGGFRALGSVAAPAVPELEELVHDTNCAMYAAAALGYVGAIEPLLDLLGNERAAVRAAAASAMGYARESAQPAVPKLIPLVQDPEETVRVAAAESLGKIGLEPSASVPALVQALQDDSPAARTAAATALGSFKKGAQTAVPALEEATKDSVREVRRAARRALELIRGN